MQRDGDGEASERDWLRDEIGGSIYLRLSTRPIEQNNRIGDPGAASGHRRRRLLAAHARTEL
jgi:pyruvate dehydrogenase E1 component